jgi:hypothetical protein
MERSCNERREANLVMPGPYIVCKVSIPDPSTDSARLDIVKYGYDTASDAHGDLPNLADEKEICQDELVVIRVIDREDAERFVD